MEASELAMQVVEVSASEDLEELVLLQSDRAAFVEEHQDLVSKAALDCPGCILAERAVDDLDRQRVEGVLHEGASPRRRMHDRGGKRFGDMADLVLGDRPPLLEGFFFSDQENRDVAP